MERQRDRRLKVLRSLRQRALGVGLVSLLFLPAPGQAASPYRAVQQGNALYQAGQYEAAEQQYRAAAQALPETAALQFNLGNAFYKQQDYGNAQEHYLRAGQTDNRLLASRVKYNLGNVKYQQALEALRTFDDAVTPLRLAITYYRESLEADPPYQEARYNLELAYLLLRQLQPPRRQEQPLAESQEQGSGQNQEQPFQPPTQEQRSQPQDVKPETSQEAQGQHAEHATQPHASLDNADAPSAPTTEPQELSAEEAERLLEAIRQRARQADKHRQQWRRARSAPSRVDKEW
jgi:Ca-activated chloride channel homolog